MKRMEEVFDIHEPPEDASPSEVLAWAENYGVDLSLLRSRLRMTVDQRMQSHDDALEFALSLREAMKKKEKELNVSKKAAS